MFTFGLILSGETLLEDGFSGENRSLPAEEEQREFAVHGWGFLACFQEVQEGIW